MKVSSHSAYRYVDGPDDGSDESQTEGQDINDGRNYNQPEINGEAYYEEVIQKFPMNGMVLTRNQTLRIRNKIMKHKWWTILMTSIKNCLCNLKTEYTKAAMNPHHYPIVPMFFQHLLIKIFTPGWWRSSAIIK